MAARKAKPRTTVAGVEGDLRALPSALAGSGLAASALALAREIDSGDTSATAKAACSRSLVQAMRELRGLVPAREQADTFDDLAARRAERRASGVG